MGGLPFDPATRDLAPTAGGRKRRGENGGGDHEDADEPYLHLMLLSSSARFVQSD